jgi:hypothetical protein
VVAGTLTLSSRMEFNDCQSQSVLIQGDPYLETTSEYAFDTVPTSPTSALPNGSSTTRMTGGLRITSNGVQGRLRYDCSHVMTWQVLNGVPQFSTAASGTIVWEQPIGSEPRVRPCGPSSR